MTAKISFHYNRNKSKMQPIWIHNLPNNDMFQHSFRLYSRRHKPRYSCHRHPQKALQFQPIRRIIKLKRETGLSVISPAGTVCGADAAAGDGVGGSADLSGYADAAAVSDWALTAVRWANSEGLNNGRTTTTLVPNGTAARAETATILMRFCLDVAGLE